MTAATLENDFETNIVAHLVEHGGWSAGEPAAFDPEVALAPASALGFLRDCYAQQWERLERQHGAGLGKALLTSLRKELDLKGSLHVLRHGFTFFGQTLKMAIFRPAHGLNPDIVAKYACNRLEVIRQAKCHPGTQDRLDLLLVVNGIPVATAELKNELTNQTVHHAMRQYRTDRKPTAPLFAFTGTDAPARSVVHFAVDTQQVQMTTQLLGDKTFFLPLNRGSHPGSVGCGAGNPPHPSGYRSAYLWEEILQRDQFLDILGNFVFVETKEQYRVDPDTGAKKRVLSRRVIFPRYHQLDAVRLLLGQAQAEGPGRNYLVQHSAGSGKTNSIAWLSHRLACLHDAQDRKCFDCVVVITDRRILDKQLQDAIYQIEHKQGVVQPIDEDSKQLAAALVDGTHIIITTLQKFPLVMKRLTEAVSEDGGSVEVSAQRIRDRRYAVIVDEAHSSQTGEGAGKMKQVLGQADAPFEGEEAAGPDGEDAINALIEHRGPRSNLSFFAFTATPKGKTLQLFGRPDSAGIYWPSHVYSMRQAIEEGFILDVLQHYTTYRTFYQLAKAIEQDPDVPKKKAVAALARYMSLHSHNIEQKTAIMVEHFRSNVAHLLGGRAKAMVVTASRLHAVRYMRAFERYIAQQGYGDIRPLVAFSGSVSDPETGLDYTEPGMNTDPSSGKPIGEKELPEKFGSDDFQVLLVANKYQTGFDQPLLHTMYVDRRLSGIQAVQTLSRLNRSYPGKEQPFVLDFVNEEEEILKSFQPFYEVTSLTKPASPDQLEALKHELDTLQVYHWSEVEAFAAIFFRQRAVSADHGQMNKHLAPAIDRYRGLSHDDDRRAFRDKLSAFVSLYAFLGQLLPWAAPDYEKLSAFGKYLLNALPSDGGLPNLGLEDDVALQYYRLEKVRQGAIELAKSKAGEVAAPVSVGTGKSKEERAPLSTIIEVLNERFGTAFTHADQLFIEAVQAEALDNDHAVAAAQSNHFNDFVRFMPKVLEELMISRLDKNGGMVTLFMDNPAIREVMILGMAKNIYDQVANPRAG